MTLFAAQARARRTIRLAREHNSPIAIRFPDLACQVYQETDIPLDRLPYTPEFEQMHKSYVRQSGQKMTLAEFWRGMMNLRKGAVLPKVH